jgi:hypothetical protein
LDTEQITAAKHMAAAKSVGYQTQLRMWIAEGSGGNRGAPSFGLAGCPRFRWPALTRSANAL